MIRRLYFLAIFAISHFSHAQESELFVINSGKVQFKSDAPLELIEASSSELKGLIDFSKATFAFSIPVNSFEGFNSKLQQEHFNENYMETPTYPRATFSGKLIETPDITQDGEYLVRVKGKLSVHGVEKERIIQSKLNVKNGKITISSDFSILLHDHNIEIPKVVKHKIAETIFVTISATAEKK